MYSCKIGIIYDQVQGIKPNSFTMVSVLLACVFLLALEQGKKIHSYEIKSGINIPKIESSSSSSPKIPLQNPFSFILLEEGE